MAPVFRKITKRAFIILHIIAALFFLLACCNAFLPPQSWWFVALLGLAFPMLLVIITGFLILWIIFRSRWAMLSVACFILGYSNIRALVGIHFGKEFSAERPDNSLRILSWNVSWFDEQTKTDRSRKTYRKEMLRYIVEQDADVLCFQEYLEPNTDKKPYNNRADITKLGYPYSYVVNDYIGWKNTYQSGIAIFSRLPILDSLHIRYTGPKNFRARESLIGVDLSFNDEKIRIYTTHLQSVLFYKDDYRNLEHIRNASDSIYEASKSVLRKLILGYKFRNQQVDIARREIDSSPYPVVLCGDFNDIPNSYTYFRMKGDRQDAFREAGRGIGRTFSNLSSTLRIDYIMPDKRFDVLQYKRDLVPYSEHYPLVTDLSLPDTED